MRRLVPLSLAFLAALALAIVLLRSGVDGAGALPGAASTPQQALHPATQPPAEAAPAPVAPAAPEDRLAAREALEARTELGEQTSTCTLLGRVVDEEGAPIEGARVRLAAFRVWAEGFDVPRLPGPYDMRGFEVDTDSRGAFRIEAPPPTAPSTHLTITPGPFHDSHRLGFPAQRGPGGPALEAGERDLGEIRLATTGALSGSVRDEHGRPLPGARVSIGKTRVTTLGRDASSEADGRFLLGHAPIGTYGIRASAEGHLSAWIEPVEVEGRRETGGIDFALAAAPTLEGVVVDEHGLPLAGARLWGWPKSSGSGAGATSGADGRFVIHLPQDEPYTLGATLDGYHPWGEEHDKRILFEPGTRNLEVVLRSLQRTRFTVVDDETGEPIERFGLAILANNGSKAPRRIRTERRPPPQKLHEGGTAEASARVGIDLYLVAADGYLLAQGDVEHDSPDSPAQAVRLRRGATLGGRVLREGAPLADAPVELARISGRFLPVEISANEGFRVDRSSLVSTRTGADGRFGLATSSAGQHRLTVRPPEGAPLVLEPVSLPPGAAQDLGDLHVLPGGTIVGELLSPRGMQPAGLHVFLGDPREGLRAVCDGAGRFRFDDVPEGIHHLTPGERAGVLAAGEPVRIELASGETRVVTLDVRDRALATVELTLELGRLPAAGHRVELVDPNDPRERAQLGACDESGRVRGSVRAWGEARVVVILPGSQRLEHPELRPMLVAGETLELTARFELAGLKLRLPPSAVLPGDGRARLALEPRVADRPRQEVVFHFAGGRPMGSGELSRASGHELWAAALLPGDHTLTLELIDAQARADVELLPGGIRRLTPAEPYRSFAAEVRLVAGEELELQLH